MSSVLLTPIPSLLLAWLGLFWLLLLLLLLAGIQCP
jgi:hypothetical protein